MSYSRKPKKDLLNDYISRLSDFIRVSPHILSCKTLNSFVIWFEKLALIDKHALFFFIKGHKNSFSDEQLKFAQSQYKVRL